MLAGWVVGALVEGTVVPLLYLELPVSIVNPVLGWHATVSVLGGVAGLSWMLRRSSAIVAPAVSVAIGIGIGLWWPVWAADQDVTGLDVTLACGIGIAAVACGHAVLTRVGVRRPPRWLARSAVGVSVLLLLVQTIAIPWAPIVLAAVAGPPVVLLVRAGRPAAAGASGADGTSVADRAAAVADDVRAPAHPWRLLWLASVPPVAGATFATATALLGTAGAADVASLVPFTAQVVGGTALALWAVVTSVRHDRRLPGHPDTRRATAGDRVSPPPSPPRTARRGGGSPRRWGRARDPRRDP